METLSTGQTIETLFKQKDEIMNRFNFQKVLDHMISVDHKWQIGNEYRVPTLSELETHADWLLGRVIFEESECTNCGTGGFMVYKLPWGLSLTFQLAWA